MDEALVRAWINEASKEILTCAATTQAAVLVKVDTGSAEERCIADHRRSGLRFGRRKMLPRASDVATLSSVVFDALPNAFSHSLAQERGLSDRRLRGLVTDGALERLGHGIYRKADAPPADLDRIEIALRAPDATLCLTTALSHHDLTDVIPSEIDVALPRSRRPPRVHAPVRWHRFHEDTFLVGRETIEVDEGLSIGIYSAERSLIDAFRLRHQEGDEMAVEALRRWLKRPGATPADLLAIARRFPKAEPSLLHTLRILS